MLQGERQITFSLFYTHYLPPIIQRTLLLPVFALRLRLASAVQIFTHNLKQRTFMSFCGKQIDRKRKNVKRNDLRKQHIQKYHMGLLTLLWLSGSTASQILMRLYKFRRLQAVAPVSARVDLDPHSSLYTKQNNFKQNC
jgi:hypothetical protein